MPIKTNKQENPLLIKEDSKVHPDSNNNGKKEDHTSASEDIEEEWGGMVPISEVGMDPTSEGMDHILECMDPIMKQIIILLIHIKANLIIMTQDWSMILLKKKEILIPILIFIKDLLLNIYVIN